MLWPLVWNACPGTLAPTQAIHASQTGGVVWSTINCRKPRAFAPGLPWPPPRRLRRKLPVPLPLKLTLWGQKPQELVPALFLFPWCPLPLLFLPPIPTLQWSIYEDSTQGGEMRGSPLLLTEEEYFSLYEPWFHLLKIIQLKDLQSPCIFDFLKNSF